MTFGRSAVQRLIGLIAVPEPQPPANAGAAVPPPLCPPTLPDLGEGAPGPARELAFAVLLGDADRFAKILLGLSQATKLSPGDPALGGASPISPARPVLEYGDCSLVAGTDSSNLLLRPCGAERW